MHPQLAEVIDEFGSALQRLHRLCDAFPADAWNRRPHPARWSPGECVAHLNLTSIAYVPLLREGIAEARRLGGVAPGRYHRDFTGWMLWKGSGPPVRIKIKTTAPFVPDGARPIAELLSEFERLQDAQIACARDADGLPIHRVRMKSPFNARLRYNLYAALTILPRHQHRHLWQAERSFT